MQRDIRQIVCDGCYKVGEVVNDTLPSNWRHFEFGEGHIIIEFDAHSSGCAEKKTVEIIRNQFYVEQPKATL